MFDAKPEFVFRTDTKLVQVAIVFLGYKHVPRFFNQGRIYCDETLIVDNLDFIYELNILEATYTDEMKRKHSMTYVCGSAVTEKPQNKCGAYLVLANITIISTIKLAYEVIVPMTTFNIFAKITYLPRLFGVWTFEIVQTLDNMAFKVIAYNGVAMRTCTHTRRELGFQFYNVNYRALLPYTANTYLLGHWLLFQTGNYKI
jgi:hypothetical protein